MKTTKCKSCGKRYKLSDFTKYAQEELENCQTCIRAKELVKLYEQAINDSYKIKGIKAEIKLSCKIKYIGTQK